MAFPNKNSRRIHINGIDFRWIIGPNDGYNLFYAEREGVKGRSIEVYFRTDINKFWVEFPYVKELNLKVIYPKEAALIIREALRLGWNPLERKPPLVFDWNDQVLIKRANQD